MTHAEHFRSHHTVSGKVGPLGGWLGYWFRAVRTPSFVSAEIHGGEDAFINIKYMIPTYESYVLN